jgi:putative drug exporter of the RND superfamily
VFAGGTVIIALLSLWVAGIPLVASLGYASAVAVFTAVLAAITLLPAMLALAGKHLFGARLPAFLRPGPGPGRRRCGAGGRRPSPPTRWPAGWPRWRSWLP